MQPRKLKVVFAFFPYGGNGNTASEHPDIRNWLIPVVLKANSDERIQPIAWRKGIDYLDRADTPVTMTRNEAFEWAKSVGADVLVTVDSDNTPDVMLDIDPTAKPFFDTSFDFLYRHWEKGPVIIGAPYCGPPMHPSGYGNENVYVFLWRNFDSTSPVERSKLDQYTREEAAWKIGMEPVAALPTGCIMYDLRILDLIEPPYFEYRYDGDGEACPTCRQHKKGVQAKKSTTEDVFFTRDIALAGCAKLGYNPVYCNWDSWAGHWKPRCVGKPVMLAADQISESFVKIVESGTTANSRLMHVERKRELPRSPFQPTGAQPAKSKPADRVHNTDEEDMSVLQQIVTSEASLRAPRNEKLTIVELGSWTGDSAIAMCEAVNSVCPLEVHCIDHWNGGNEKQRTYAETHDVYEEFRRNIESRGFERLVIPHRDDTVSAASHWGVGNSAPNVDLLFVDAGHSYEECLADILAWIPYLKAGGMICGHDYSHVFPGVKRAVHEVFGFDDVVVLGTMWIVRFTLQIRSRLIAEHDVSRNGVACSA